MRRGKFLSLSWAAGMSSTATMREETTGRN